MEWTWNGVEWKWHMAGREDGRNTGKNQHGMRNDMERNARDIRTSESQPEQQVHRRGCEPKTQQNKVPPACRSFCWVSLGIILFAMHWGPGFQQRVIVKRLQQLQRAFHELASSGQMEHLPVVNANSE